VIALGAPSGAESDYAPAAGGAWPSRVKVRSSASAPSITNMPTGPKTAARSPASHVGR
jgi:hypothetical protein